MALTLSKALRKFIKKRNARAALSREKELFKSARAMGIPVDRSAAEKRRENVKVELKDKLDKIKKAKTAKELNRTRSR